MKILIVNQPLNNRGDESAHKALIRTMLSEMPTVSIRVLWVGANPDSVGQFAIIDKRVEYVNLKDIRGFHRIAITSLKHPTVYSLNKLHPTFRRLITYYKEADWVVCAPGGICMGGFQNWMHLFFLYLAKKMGKKRIIAETGAGQHGVATATGCALFGFPCTVYMGAEDVKRQSLNVFRMKMLGATVVSVTRGQQTLSDAVDEALEDLVKNYHDTFYLIGSAVGPHPYPMMVRDFQSVIGTEARRQILEAEGRLPDYAVACVGGGSNAIGLFSGFLNDSSVKLVGVEAAGKGLETKEHCATMAKGTPGVLHGAYTYLLQDEEGKPLPTHSISAGLDYPGVGAEHSMLKDTGRAVYESATDEETIDACLKLCRIEGIIPALESSHALAYAMKLAKTLDPDKIIIVNLSGRGDKDVDIIREHVKL